MAPAGLRIEVLLRACRNAAVSQVDGFGSCSNNARAAALAGGQLSGVWPPTLDDYTYFRALEVRVRKWPKTFFAGSGSK